MLGLPDAIRACLFDLDGVLTKTAVVHAAAWKEMFDEFLRARVGADRRAVRRRSTARRLRRVRRRQAALRRRARRSSPRAGSSCPRARRTTRPTPRRSTASATARTSSCSTLIASDGVEAYEGSVRYVEAARDAGLRRAVVSSSANCREVLAGRRHRGPLRGCASTGSSARAEHLHGQAGARHVPRRGAEARGRAGARPRCSRTRSPASRPGRAGDFGYVVGVDRVGPGRGAARARRRRRRRATSPSCSTEP